jgi:hypothetical protein
MPREQVRAALANNSKNFNFSVWWGAAQQTSDSDSTQLRQLLVEASCRGMQQLNAQQQQQENSENSSSLLIRLYVRALLQICAGTQWPSGTNNLPGTQPFVAALHALAQRNAAYRS